MTGNINLKKDINIFEYKFTKVINQSIFVNYFYLSVEKR